MAQSMHMKVCQDLYHGKGKTASGAYTLSSKVMVSHIFPLYQFPFHFPFDSPLLGVIPPTLFAKP